MNSYTMKKLVCLLMLVGFGVTLSAQYDNSIDLFVASAAEWGEGDHGFQGSVRMTKQHGEAVAGAFVVQGDNYVIRAGDKEWYGNGEFMWEVSHRARRVKREYFDPYGVPAIVFAFRFYRMDLTSENVGLAGTQPEVTIDVEFGTSAVQGSHRVNIDRETLAIEKVWIQVSQDEFLEMAEIANLRKDTETPDAIFTVDEGMWQQKGYTIMDLAKEGAEPLPLDEQVLRD